MYYMATEKYGNVICELMTSFFYFRRHRRELNTLSYLSLHVASPTKSPEYRNRFSTREISLKAEGVRTGGTESNL